MTDKHSHIVKTDRQSRKSRKAIKTAFMELARNRDPARITIKEIAELADLNRKTFYTHYQSIDDVIDEIENDIIERILCIIRENDISEMPKAPYQIFIHLTNLISEDISFYEMFVNTTMLNTMLIKIENVLMESMVNELQYKASVGAETLNYCIEFTVSGLIATYRKWFNSDKKVSLEELSNQISMVISNGLSSIIK